MGLYARWITDWENKLCFRSTDRVVREFDWGAEWAERWPTSKRHTRNGDDDETYIKIMNRLAVEHPVEFFSYDVPADFRLQPATETEPALLRFTSAVETPYPENNLVHAQWYPAADKPGRKRVAVIVLPHWNASLGQHGALCKGMSKLGMSALRLSLPYHDYRMPPELRRADYAVSSNVGRTIDATRQAVIDVRSAVDWLYSQGFERVGICGTSLGSCYAFLASAYDTRIGVNVFNHCSTYFADVVWEGLSTQHIRKGIEKSITIERLRDAWLAVSPPHHFDNYAAHKNKKTLFIYAKYDTTFPVKYSEQVILQARSLNLDHKVVVLPCGHYTVGETPFKFMDGYHICSFLKRNL